MNRPRVSVVVSHRCSDHGLEDTVDSILAQSCHDIEILILAHGYDEPCGCIFTSAAHPKTRFFSAKGASLGDARNLTAEIATGEYLCSFHARDKLESTYLEKACNVLDEDASVAVVVPWVQFLGDKSGVWKPGNIDLITLLCKRTVCRAALVRRSAVRGLGGYDTGVAEQALQDWDLWINLLEKDFQIATIPEVLVYHGNNPDCLRFEDGDSQTETYFRSVRYLIEKHEKIYNKHLLDILLFNDGQLADVLRSNYDIERHINTWLVPAVVSRQDELKRLAEKSQNNQTQDQQQQSYGLSETELKHQLFSAQHEILKLTESLNSSRQEVAMLKASRSWKLTAPLRFLYDSFSRASRNSVMRGVQQAPKGNEEHRLQLLFDESSQITEPDGRPDRAALTWGDLNRTRPISPERGADRGRCIDRYYIEQFLDACANDIHGCILEVCDNDYTVEFGGNRVEHSDVIDCDPTNPRATIITDLCNASVIPPRTYDCFIMTQTLHAIYDIRAVLAECVRVLKPGGVLLATLPCVSKIAHEQGLNGDFWRFTKSAAERLFAEFFPSDRLEVHSYGNVLVNLAYLYGLACHELAEDEFKYHDPACPSLISVRAKTAENVATQS